MPPVCHQCAAKNKEPLYENLKPLYENQKAL